MLCVLLYPDGQRREIVLAGVPATGDTIMLRGEHRPLVVEHRLWMESGNGPGPEVLISVRASPR